MFEVDGLNTPFKIRKSSGLLTLLRITQVQIAILQFFHSQLYYNKRGKNEDKAT